MKTIEMAGRRIKAIGYGCMGLSQAYESCSRKQAISILNTILDLGYDHLDTAALYGFGANEELLREAIGHRRGEYFLASKCGLFKNSQGVREINGRPEKIRQTCQESLKRLGTDNIDLYYLHRKDPNVPIEESVGELARLKEEGFIGAIGLSEVAPDTLERALKITQISALQSEYSLWSRNPENQILDLCRVNGIILVAYSPLARGFLSDKIMKVADLEDKDLRLTMPRFQGANFSSNQRVLRRLIDYCESKELSTSQASLAWLLTRGDFIAPIPGTRHEERARSNIMAGTISLNKDVIEELGEIFSPSTIRGERYNEKIMRQVDAEKYRFKN